MLKKLATSKILRVLFSLVLIYFAFRKVDIGRLVWEIRSVPLWFLITMFVYVSAIMFVGGIRWCILVIPKPRVIDFWNFTKAGYVGSFYSLFFPTAIAGDMLKWLPLLKKYPNLSKTRLAGTVLVDRIVGFTAFVLMGCVALIAGKMMQYHFPEVLLWIFLGLALGVTVFYVLVFTVNFERIFLKIFGRLSFMMKIVELIKLFQAENKKRILWVFIISIFAEPIWILPVWFYSLIFGAGISLIQVFIFVPVIILILVLPVSVAGFGARENLYLYFFGALGFADEKVLLVSTFGGIISVLVSLFGGIFVMFP